jgi:nicotinamidase-related amidase
MNGCATRSLFLLESRAVVLIVSRLLPAAESPRDEQAIREVLDGSRNVAHAAWWGYRTQESTDALQAAINSGAQKVIVQKMPGPWIVDQIQLADNQELFFEPGVVVQAKKGAFRGKSDSLFTAWNKTNVKLTGYDATLLDASY